jgi:hypothetical protein
MKHLTETRPEKNEHKGNTFEDASFPISIDYCNHWEEWQSIREIVANCFDAMYEYLYN